MTTQTYRYFIFAGEKFYPSGGASDLIGGEFHLEDAKSVAKSLIGRELKTIDNDDELLPEDSEGNVKIDWSHVLDIVTGQIIATYGQQPLGSSTKILFD
ncbi:hypothetical protein [Vibrio sp. R78045]|uniref:hypothetical protein n=1 Tax=Vibrio sp. R78045 TaxID=3093868 RepID=UPI0036F2BA8A